MWVRVVVATILLLLPAAAFAQTEKRIALLIGNKDYKAGVGALTNPLNDIRVVGDALKSVGFEVLKSVQNARRADMLLAIHDFAGKLKVAGPDAVGFLYYSGHGIASATMCVSPSWTRQEATRCHGRRTAYSGGNVFYSAETARVDQRRRSVRHREMGTRGQDERGRARNVCAAARVKSRG
jgi:uncharacterized caspase-like protein